MCRVCCMSVNRGYYRFLRRPERGLRDRQLLKQIYDCLREDEENGVYLSDHYPVEADFNLK